MSLTDIRRDLTIHIVELGPIKWNLNSELEADREKPQMGSPDESKMSNQNGTQAVDRAARLLSEVVHSADPMTFTGLSAATGLAKSTTSRLLLALERNGLVRRDDHGRFLPGEMFVSFAWRGGAEAGAGRGGPAVPQRLGKATGETINLGVASNGIVEQIAQVDSTFLIGGTNWVGMSVPLDCSALGKVLLAYGTAQPPPGKLERRTDKTITTGDRRCAPTWPPCGPRRRGDRRGTRARPDRGGHPIRGYDGAVVAALSVSAPTNRMSRDGVAAVAGYCAEEAVGPVRGARLPAAGEQAEPQGRLTMSEPRGAAPTGLRSDGGATEGGAEM